MYLVRLLKRSAICLLVMFGATQIWSQNSEPPLRTSEEHSKTWELLSSRFDQTLQDHEKTLSELSTRLQTSERSGQLLQDSLSKLLKQNEDLKSYNSQIGERMQERDEDLAIAYDAIDDLETELAKIRKSYSRAIASVAGALVLLVVGIVLLIRTKIL